MLSFFFPLLTSLTFRRPFFHQLIPSLPPHFSTLIPTTANSSSGKEFWNNLSESVPFSVIIQTQVILLFEPSCLVRWCKETWLWLVGKIRNKTCNFWKSGERKWKKKKEKKTARWIMSVTGRVLHGFPYESKKSKGELCLVHCKTFFSSPLLQSQCTGF